MPDNDLLTTLHAAVNCYLSTLRSGGGRMAEACPPVGGPYRQRLSRLRARLAFDSSPARSKKAARSRSRSCRITRARPPATSNGHRAELRRAIAAWKRSCRRWSSARSSMARGCGVRHADGTGRLRRERMTALRGRAAELRGEHEPRIAIAAQKECAMKWRGWRSGWLEAEITDPVTGLMNRREMERSHRGGQDARRSAGAVAVRFQRTSRMKWLSRWARGWARNFDITT